MGGGPEVWGSCWEGQPAKTQLGCRVCWVCWGHISSAADPLFSLSSSPTNGICPGEWLDPLLPISELQGIADFVWWRNLGFQILPGVNFNL